MLSYEDLSYLNVTPQRWVDTQMTTPDPLDKSNESRFSVSRLWVEKTTGKHNQDVVAMFNGKKGRGKSNCTLSLGYWCSVRTAEVLGGQPSDYFSIDNVAIMNIDKLIDCLTQEAKNQIIIGDDNGTVHGARQYKGEMNQYVNNILVTMRPQHNIYMVSAPDQGHVDKQEREIGEYMIQMEHNPAAMDSGFSIYKFKIRDQDTTTNKSFYRYPYWRGEKVLRCVSLRAPKALEDEYDKEREKAMRRLQANKEEMKKNMSGENQHEKTESRNKERKETMTQIALTAVDEFERLKSEGKSTYEICEYLGISTRTLTNYKQIVKAYKKREAEEEI